MTTPLSIEPMTSARLPTALGAFRLALYRSLPDGKEHMALTLDSVEGQADVLVRVHSECFTGDVLGSLRCDCGEQLHAALERIAAAGRGALIYLRQEGRGIGLFDKLRAYNLQDQGYDTVDANLKLGHQADERDYSVAGLILRALGVRSVRLLTNNPHKIESLRGMHIPVTAREPLLGAVTPENAAYLRAKADRMQHMLGALAPVAPRRGNGRGG